MHCSDLDPRAIVGPEPKPTMGVLSEKMKAAAAARDSRAVGEQVCYWLVTRGSCKHHDLPEGGPPQVPVLA